MHHDLALLTNITFALVTAFIGGYLARAARLPTLVGYLLAGMVIGPFTPGFVGDVGDISQLAEMGVIFMLFGVGLHFSLNDLWAVRRIAIPGPLLQMLATASLGVALTQLWGWSIGSSLVLGLAISIASTVVLLRGLVDNGLLNTPHGRVAVGWLVLEDLATVGLLVLLPALLGNSANPWQTGALAIANTVLFILLMLFVGQRVIPWLLTHIAHTRSRELFILAVLAGALGTAYAAGELFGVSLALGAFLAGVVVSESEVGHQVGAELMPFREIFAVLFFVSVGMLVNPAQLVQNAPQVLALTALIVAVQPVITLLLGLILPASGRTMLVVAAGRSQIGEFSFIVGQAGVSLGVLSSEQYGLILAASLLSIVLNPLLYKLLPAVEDGLRRAPLLTALLERGGPTPEPIQDRISDHVVVVGYGRVGEHIVDILRRLEIPHLVVERDAQRAAEFQSRGIPTLFGDAANSELLTHAGLERARAIVITVPDEAAAELIVAAARDLAPRLRIVARATTRLGVQRLSRLGAHDVIHPELEGGLEIVRYTLLELGYPMVQVQAYIDAVRRDGYDTALNSYEEYRYLQQLMTTAHGMGISWRVIPPDSPVRDQTLAEANIRAHAGASIIALVREHHLIPNPKSDFRLAAGDLVGLIGEVDQLAAAERLIDPAAALAPSAHSAALHPPASV